MTAGPNTNDKDTMSGAERRRYVRVRTEAAVSIRLVGVPPAEHAHSVRNIGTGGLLLVIPRMLPIGTRLQMRMTVKSLGIEFTTGGRVVWGEHNEASGAYYVGVCFVGLEPLQRRNVLALIGLPREDQDDLERRQFIRLSKRIAIEYSSHRKFFKRKHVASTKDISLGGATIVAEKPMAKGTRINMSIHLEDGQAKSLDVEGVVLDCVRGKGKGTLSALHVQFQNPSQEVRDRLAGYISKILTAAAIDDVTQPATRRES